MADPHFAKTLEWPVFLHVCLLHRFPACVRAPLCTLSQTSGGVHPGASFLTLVLCKGIHGGGKLQGEIKRRGSCMGNQGGNCRRNLLPILSDSGVVHPQSCGFRESVVTLQPRIQRKVLKREVSGY